MFISYIDFYYQGLVFIAKIILCGAKKSKRKKKDETFLTKSSQKVK